MSPQKNVQQAGNANNHNKSGEKKSVEKKSVQNVSVETKSKETPKPGDQNETSSSSSESESEDENPPNIHNPLSTANMKQNKQINSPKASTPLPRKTSLNGPSASRKAPKESSSSSSDSEDENVAKTKQATQKKNQAESSTSTGSSSSDSDKERNTTKQSSGKIKGPPPLYVTSGTIGNVSQPSKVPKKNVPTAPPTSSSSSSEEEAQTKQVPAEKGKTNSVPVNTKKRKTPTSSSSSSDSDEAVKNVKKILKKERQPSSAKDAKQKKVQSSSSESSDSSLATTQKTRSTEDLDKTANNANENVQNQPTMELHNITHFIKTNIQSFDVNQIQQIVDAIRPNGAVPNFSPYPPSNFAMMYQNVPVPGGAAHPSVPPILPPQLSPFIGVSTQEYQPNDAWSEPGNRSFPMGMPENRDALPPREVHEPRGNSWNNRGRFRDEYTIRADSRNSPGDRPRSVNRMGDGGSGHQQRVDSIRSRARGDDGDGYTKRLDMGGKFRRKIY